MNPSLLPRRALAGLAAFILLAVATSPFWTLLIIRGHASRITNDTLPSLIATSLASASISVAFLETTLAVATEDSASQGRYLAQLVAQTRKTDEELNAYATLIDDASDRRYYDRLLDHRRQYRATRDAVIVLLNEGKRAEAMRLFHETGLAQFKAYITALNQLREHTIAEAGQRSRQIMGWCYFLLVVQGALLVYFFVYGFFVPLVAVLEKITARSRYVEDI